MADRGVGSSAQAPWWLAAGDEDCAFCEQSFALGSEWRCVHCDAAVCVLCVQRVERHSVCPGCGAPRRD